MSKILASLVSLIKVNATELSKLAVSAANNTKLQLKSLGYETKAKVELLVENTKLTITSSKTLLGDIVTTGKLKVTYSLGIFFTAIDKVKISASNLTNTINTIEYVARTKLDSIVQEAKASLKVSYDNTVLVASKAEKVVANIIVLSKIKAQIAAGIFLTDWIRYYENIVEAVESVVLLFSKNLGDTVTLSDVTNILVDYDKVYIDTGTIVENISSISTFNRVFNDTLTILDVAGEFVPGREKETLSTIDIASIQLGNLTRDNINTTDIATIYSQFNKVYLETTNILENLSFIKTFNRNLIDTANTLDTVFILRGLILQDSLYNIDSVNTLSSYFRNIADSNTVTDSISILSGFNNTPSEIVYTIDNIIVLQGHIQNIQEVSTIIDTAPILAINSSLNDLMFIEDSLISSSNYLRNYIDITTVVDSSFVELIFNRSYREISTILDQNLSVGIGLGTLDYTIFSDTVTTAMGYFKNSEDTVSLIEKFIASLTFRRNYFDTVLLDSNISLNIIKPFYEIFEVLDVNNTLTQYIRNINEVAEFKENITTLSTFKRVYTDISLISDSNISININSVKTDGVYTTDSSYLKIQPKLFEEINTIDTFSVLNNFYKIYSDTLGIDDSSISLFLANNYKDISYIIDSGT
ncbi:MAG: hypothetical protein ACO3UU_03000, partial [Minisyncoccia bacterium]